MSQTDYNVAMSDIRKPLTKREGGEGAEKRAAQAYQGLVREGLAPQIKKKWRIGKHYKNVSSN